MKKKKILKLPGKKNSRSNVTELETIAWDFSTGTLESRKEK